MRVGKREPRERVLWGEIGGRETLKVPASRWGPRSRVRTPRLPCGAPDACPGLGDTDDRLAPRGNLSRPLAGRGREARVQAPGAKHPSSPGRTASSLRLQGRAAPGPPPGAAARRPAGARWAPQPRRAAGYAICPGDNGREGQKRVKKLG